MRLGELVETSQAVAATRSRLEKIAQLAACIQRMPRPLVSAGVAYLTGELPQGRLGVGYAALRDLRGTPAVAASTLDLGEVDRIFTAVKGEAGAGSVERRARLLRDLLARATAGEQELLVRLMIGELRQGALEGVVIDATARAFAVSADAVRRAAMLAGSLPPVAAALAEQGATGLDAFTLQLFHPVQPMLADTATDVEAALERLGEAAFEYKLDGARVQIHKDGDRVEVYSRALNRVTPAVPEVVERVAALPARRLVLDGETIGLGRDRRPLPFQVTMRRFGRRLDVEALRHELPLEVFFFDVLRIDDQLLLDRPLHERFAALSAATGGADLPPRLLTANSEEADAFMARALADGHEGVMAKSLGAPYAAGRRGQEWLKLKPAHTLDCKCSPCPPGLA